MTIQECIDKWKRRLDGDLKLDPNGHISVFTWTLATREFIKDLEEIQKSDPPSIPTGLWGDTSFGM
jgi:hypothetical protein